MSRYTRAPEHDWRIARGDDFAGDAWRDSETGDIRYVAVGQNPNDRDEPDSPQQAVLRHWLDWAYENPEDWPA